MARSVMGVVERWFNPQAGFERLLAEASRESKEYAGSLRERMDEEAEQLLMTILRMRARIVKAIEEAQSISRGSEAMSGMAG